MIETSKVLRVALVALRLSAGGYVAVNDVLAEIRTKFLLNLVYMVFALAVMSVIIEQYTARIVPNLTLLLAVCMIIICITNWLLMRWKPAVAPYSIVAALLCLGLFVFEHYGQSGY